MTDAPRSSPGSETSIEKALRHADIDLSMLLGLEGEIPSDVKDGIRKTLALIDTAKAAASVTEEHYQAAMAMSEKHRKLWVETSQQLSAARGEVEHLKRDAYGSLQPAASPEKQQLSTPSRPETRRALLPCPFCGSQPVWDECETILACQNDECFGPRTTATDDDAIEQWNKREPNLLAALQDALIWLDPDAPNESRYEFRNQVIEAVAAAIAKARGASQ